MDEGGVWSQIESLYRADFERVARAITGDRETALESVQEGFADALSPDGTRLAFVRGHIVGRLVTTHMSLYVATVDNSDVRRLARCDGCGDALAGRLAWSPDGRWIAFSRANRHGRGQSIWVIAAAGGGRHAVSARSVMGSTRPGLRMVV
jgi:dipeptidyl aminopeptidase/acylaminoacyl peptidase